MLRIYVVAAFSLTCIVGYAQHAKREVAFSFAAGGQDPLATSGDKRSGFFQDPLILNLRYQVATDYITSFSLYLEHINERRPSRIDLWSDFPNTTDPPPYNAEIAEELSMTFFGVEAARTLFRTGDLRIALTLGFGYGLGSASADVRKLTANQTRTFESCDLWHGIHLSASLRGRYTIYQSEQYDIGLTASLRTWGFPTIGSFGDCRSSYNGPAFTSLYEIGYLAGVSVGLF